VAAAVRTHLPNAAGAVRILALASSLALAVGAGLPARGGEAPDRENDCFWQLTEGRSSDIRCSFPTALGDDDRAELKRITRGILLDARCMVEVVIARHLIDAAIETPDNIFKAPPQPVTCVVTTSKKHHTLSFTFAPRVVFAGGEAVEATPAMSPVEGVAGVLSWPVRQWVNRSNSIEEGMLKVINAYLKRHGTRARASAPSE